MWTAQIIKTNIGVDVTILFVMFLDPAFDAAFIIPEMQVQTLFRHAARWGAAAPPDFGGSVNPISTRGTHYPHPVLPAPPDF